MFPKVRISNLLRLALVGGHLGACSSLIGIEELDSNPANGGGQGGAVNGGNPGKPGGGATTTTAGQTSPSAGSSAQGGTGPGPAAGSAGDGGDGGPVASAGTAGSAGSQPVGGSSSGSGGQAPQGGTAGAGGEGGEPSPADPTVHGKVIDFLGRPVAQAPVTIGSETVETNAQGEFTIANIPDQYDVALVVDLKESRAGTYAWVYQGLSRRDPTLQVYRGRSDVSENVTFTITNGVFGGSSRTSIAFGCVDGSSDMSFSSQAVQRGLNWYGPRSTSGTLHGLRWTTGSGDLPTSFQAFSSQQFTVDSENSAPSMVTIALPNSTVEPATVSGQVTGPDDNRSNSVFVHFTSDGSIQIVDDTVGPESFNYVVPALPNSVLTVAASAGRTPGEYAVAHKAVPANQANIALTIPAFPRQLLPGEDATGVQGSTNFEWARGTGASPVSLIHIEDAQFYRGIFVLTSRTQVAFPSVPGFTLRPGAEHYWQIESHGSLSDMDEATGPGGFQDSFGASWDGPAGPKRGEGTFAMSYRRYFTTAP